MGESLDCWQCVHLWDTGLLFFFCQCSAFCPFPVALFLACHCCDMVLCHSPQSCGPDKPELRPQNPQYCEPKNKQTKKNLRFFCNLGYICLGFIFIGIHVHAQVEINAKSQKLFSMFIK